MLSRLAWRLVVGSLVTAALVAPHASTLAAEPTFAADAAKPEAIAESLPQPTLGGHFSWTDELLYRDWRIQRSAGDGSYRLLDGLDVRRASGSFDECRERLEKIRLRRDLEPMRGTVVILLHGLGRYRGSMSEIADVLQKDGNLETLSFGYASLDQGLDDHARSLTKVLAHLDQVEHIHFVAHSLGNLVVRTYFAHAAEAAAGPDRRIARLAMLGPPNHRPKMAVVWSSHPISNMAYRKLLGPAGDQLAAGWHDFEKRLAVPTCEFGIIAGGAGHALGYNPLLAGDDDGLLTIEETRLRGARDFIVMPVSHQGLMTEREVTQTALRFLTEGRFRGDERRYPIFEDDEPTPREAFAIRLDERRVEGGRVPSDD